MDTEDFPGPEKSQRDLYGNWSKAEPHLSKALMDMSTKDRERFDRAEVHDSSPNIMVFT